MIHGCNFQLSLITSTAFPTLMNVLSAITNWTSLIALHFNSGKTEALPLTQTISKEVSQYFYPLTCIGSHRLRPYVSSPIFEIWTWNLKTHQVLFLSFKKLCNFGYFNVFFQSSLDHFQLVQNGQTANKNLPVYTYYTSSWCALMAFCNKSHFKVVFITYKALCG